MHGIKIRHNGDMKKEVKHRLAEKAVPEKTVAT